MSYHLFCLSTSPGLFSLLLLLPTMFLPLSISISLLVMSLTIFLCLFLLFLLLGSTIATDVLTIYTAVVSVPIFFVLSLALPVSLQLALDANDAAASLADLALCLGPRLIVFRWICGCLDCVPYSMLDEVEVGGWDVG